MGQFITLPNGATIPNPFYTADAVAVPTFEAPLVTQQTSVSSFSSVTTTSTVSSVSTTASAEEDCFIELPDGRKVAVPCFDDVEPITTPSVPTTPSLPSLPTASVDDCFIELPDGRKVAVPCDDSTVTPTPIPPTDTTNPTTGHEECFIELPDGRKVAIPCEDPVDPPVTTNPPTTNPTPPVEECEKGLYEDMAEVNGMTVDQTWAGYNGGYTTYGIVESYSLSNANDEMVIDYWRAASAELKGGDDTVYIGDFIGYSACIHGGDGFDTAVIGKGVTPTFQPDSYEDVDLTTFIDFEQIILDSDVTMDLDYMGLLHNHDNNGNLFIRGTENNILDIGSCNDNDLAYAYYSAWNRDSVGTWFQSGSKEVDGVCYDIYKNDCNTQYSVYVETAITVI